MTIVHCRSYSFVVYISAETANDTTPPDGATAPGGPWPPLQCASKPLNSLLCLSIHLTLRSLTLYIYGAPILDVPRSHTTTQHSR